jgi:hypothetical protein
MSELLPGAEYARLFLSDEASTEVTSDYEQIPVMKVRGISWPSKLVTCLDGVEEHFAFNAELSTLYGTPCYKKES